MDSRQASSITLSRRTAIIANELKDYNIDLVALQETHLRGEGQLEERGAGYTYLWSGAKDEDQTENYYGVAICVKTELVRKGIVSDPNCYSDRIMSVEVHGQHFQTTFISCYAPTLNDEIAVIETFYQDLKRFLSAIPNQRNIVLAGDFNARVGTSELHWRGVIGPHGIGRQNDNGLRLLQLCVQLDLCICNTMFQQKNQHKTTWQHPRSKQWHQIDFVITRKRNLQNVLRCRSMKGPNCDTDHLLVRASIRLVKKRFRAIPPSRPKSFNTTKLKEEQTRNAFQESILSVCPEDYADLDAETQWTIMKTAVLESAASVLGKKPTSRWDWFDDSNNEIQAVLVKKKQAHLTYVNNPTERNKTLYARCRAQSQRQIREIKEKWWIEKVREMQHYMDIHDSHNLHRCIKNIVGPVKKPLNVIENREGEQLKTKEEKMERWREHFSSILNQDTVVNLDSIRAPRRSEAPEQLQDDPPSYNEIKRAVGQLKNHKSAGSDAITAELLKGGGDTIINMFSALFKKVWEEKLVPKDWTDAVVVPLHKKGKKSSCDNYRGISLLSVPGKVLAKVLCNRLTPFIDASISDSQCGFRAERSTVDMIFATRQLVEKALEQNTEISVAFVDIRKAFDSVNREALFEILRMMDCPPNTLAILKKLHENTCATVRVDGEESPSFGVRTGVRQGCVLAPVLFLVYIQTIVANIPLRHQLGVDIIYRSDSNMFCKRGLKSKSKVLHSNVAELMFADDCALVAQTPQALQTAITAFSESAQRLGLSVNEEKTEVLFVNSIPTPIVLNNKALKEVSVFKYILRILDNKKR